MPKDIVCSSGQALRVVTDGCLLGIGGTPLSMNPVALVLQLIARKVKRLRLVVAPIGGFAADFLLGAGAAESVEFAQMGLEELGMAPNFRSLAQQGEIKTLDHT